MADYTAGTAFTREAKSVFGQLCKRKLEHLTCSTAKTCVRTVPDYRYCTISAIAFWTRGAYNGKDRTETLDVSYSGK